MTELVQKGTLPTLEQLDDAGKAVVVNPAGSNYTLGTAQSGASVALPAAGPPEVYTWTADDLSNKYGSLLKIEFWTPEVTGPICWAPIPDNGDSDWSDGNLEIDIWFGDTANVDYPAKTGSFTGPTPFDPNNEHDHTPWGGPDGYWAHQRNTYVYSGYWGGPRWYPNPFFVTAGQVYTIVIWNFAGLDGVGHTIDLAGLRLSQYPFGGIEGPPPPVPDNFQVELGISPINGELIWAPGPLVDGATGLLSYQGLGVKTCEGIYNHAEGEDTSIIMARNSHVEGGGCAVLGGESNHAEGNQSITRGDQCHAEGGRTIAKGSTCHAEGSWTIAEGSSCHAEGASSHAEGTGAHAQGIYAHAWRRGEDAHGCGRSDNGSFIQVCRLVLSASFFTSGSATLGLRGGPSDLPLTDERLSIVTCDVGGWRPDSGIAKRWKVEATVSRKAGVSRLIVPASITVGDADIGTSGWTLTVATSTAGLALTVAQNSGGGNVSFVGMCEIVEVGE